MPRCSKYCQLPSISAREETFEVRSINTRARATNKRSRQAKRHLGKGLCSSKKPSKTEDRGNECTHHQRKQVQLAKEEFFFRRQCQLEPLY